MINFHICVQVKKFLEQANCQLPRLSKNLFILFNHWDEVVDDDECDSEELKEEHCQTVREFLEQGLQANAVLDRTFFVSGREVCKAQENEKNGKQPSAGIVSSMHVLHQFLTPYSIRVCMLAYKPAHAYGECMPIVIRYDKEDDTDGAWQTGSFMAAL